MMLQRLLRRESLFLDGIFVATLAWIAFGALPLLVYLIALLITGHVAVEGDPLPEGFPIFLLPWWAIYPQTLLVAALTVGSWPLPLRGVRPGSRYMLVMVQTLTLPASWFVGVMALVIDPSLYPVLFPLLLQTPLLGVTVLRMILGWTRLVPLRWRQYIADDGTIIPPREIAQYRPSRPWDGRIRLNGQRL